MRGKRHFFSAFTNSKFLCIDKCLTVTAVLLVLSLTLNTATVSASKVKTASSQNASRLNSAQGTRTSAQPEITTLNSAQERITTLNSAQATSRPSVTVEDFSHYIDSKSQSETVVVDISEVSQE